MAHLFSDNTYGSIKTVLAPIFVINLYCLKADSISTYFLVYMKPDWSGGNSWQVNSYGFMLIIFS